MSRRLPPQEPARPRRRADRPTVRTAARTSVRAAGRVIGLQAGEPGRRRAQRRARVTLGRAVADHLAGQRAPAFLAPPLAAHRAAQLRLASTEVPAHPRPPSRPARPEESADRPGRASGRGAVAESQAEPRPLATTGSPVGSRARRSAGRDRDLAADLERLLMMVVQFLPRLAAQIRLRVAEERLGAWATGLVDQQDPAVAAARELAASAQRAVSSARAAAAASRREAVDAARLAVNLAVEAVVDVAAWVGRGLRNGTSMLVAWLVSLAVAGRRRLTRGSTAARHGLRAGSAAAGQQLRAGSATAGQQLRAGSATAGRQLRAGSAAAGRGVRGAGAGVAGAVGGLASRIDELAARGRNGSGAAGAPPPPPSVVREPDGAGNGRADEADVTLPLEGRDRLAHDPGDPTEAWWLPSSPAAPSEEAPPAAGGRAAARRRPATRDPVVAAMANGLARVTGPFRRLGLRLGRRLGPLVTALAAPPNRRRRGWLPFARPVAVALALAMLMATATAVPAAMLVADSVKGADAGLPDLEDLKQLRQPERTQVYDRNKQVIEVLKDEQDRIVIPLSKMSPTLQQAVVAAEDARFYEHRGVDDRGILRAAVTNLLSGQIDEGGSTITQQLVRNAYPDLKERSIVRKVKEAALAAQLEVKLSKQEILHRYLNRVYFGAGYYGVEAASRGYFKKRALEVSLAQAAMLAGVIREPVTADPRNHPERAKVLRDTVLDRMTQLGMVPAAEAAKAKKQPLKIEKTRRVGGDYPWFIDGLKRQLLEDERLAKTREGRIQRLFEGGLRIHTTLDRDMQRVAEEAVRRWRPPTGPDIALIAIDPRDGGVRAVVGGRNFKAEAYNSAVQGEGRQPGSSFKTFVLAAALEAGISPDSVWESSGFQDQLVCGSPWTVDNYEGGGSGPVAVRDATWRSVNGVYARLMEKLCPERVSAMAEKLGLPPIPAAKRVPSMALGSAEVRPIDMASAYGTLANLGEYNKPTFFEKVDHRSGRPVIDQSPRPERRVSAALAWQVNDILKGVVAHGTGTAASIGRPQAGKTGTNQAYRDAWFVGYTPQLSVAVWMGNPKSQESMYNVQGRRVSGGSFPAQVWHDFMAVAMANQEVLDWPRPPEALTYTVLPPPPPETTEPKKKKKKRKRPGPPGNN
jgi:1A family penicillin-binding protein